MFAFIAKHRSKLFIVGLILSGLVIGITFYLAFTARYSLAEFGSRRRQSIGTLTNFSEEAIYIYVVAMLVLFAAYAVGYWLIQKMQINSTTQKQYGILLVLVVGSIGLCGVLLPMYPLDASDIYDYIMRGRMSALYEMNPMLNVPEQISTDSFYIYSSWRRTPSAYGPGWEIIAHSVSAITAKYSRDEQVIAYKLIAVSGYALTGLFIGLTLHRLAPRRVWMGLYLFLWNPLVLYMTVGRGHNDAVMTAWVAFAIFCLSRRWYTLATIGAVMGTLVKFIPALLLPIIALLALRDLGVRRWLRYVLISGVICGGLTIVLYAPYWHGLDTLRTSRRAIMYTGSVATVVRQWLMPLLDGITDLSVPTRQTPITNAFVANSTLIFFGVFYLWELGRVWRERQLLPALRSFARILLFYLLVVSLWFHGWYVIWLIAIIALIDDTPTRRLTLVFSYLVTWQALIYNTFSITTQRNETVYPWLNLVPVLIYMGYAYGYIAVYQAKWLWYKLRQPPADKGIGEQLQMARQNAGLSVSDVSDELGIQYDVLIQYERGLRPLSIEHGRKLAQRLGLSLPDWLGNKA